MLYIMFSARNPPPICTGEDIVEYIEIEVCLRIYDINIESNKFNACFEIFGKIMKLKFSKIKLGCIATNLYKEMMYIENNIINRSSDFKYLINKED